MPLVSAKDEGLYVLFVTGEVFGLLRGNLSLLETSCRDNLVVTIKNHDNLAGEQRWAMVVKGLKDSLEQLC